MPEKEEDTKTTLVVPEEDATESGSNKINLPARFLNWVRNLSSIIPKKIERSGNLLSNNSLPKFGASVSRIPLLVASLFSIYQLFQSTRNQFGQPGWIKWVLLAIFVASLFVFVLTLMKRLASFFLTLPIFLIFILVLAQMIFYESTDRFLLLAGMEPAKFWNSLWLSILIFQAFLLIPHPANKILKIIFSLPLLMGMVGLVLNLIHKIPLEASWMGVDFLEGLPGWASPIRLLFLVILPYYLVFFLLSLLIERRSVWVFNGMLLLLSVPTGFLLLTSNRIPSLFPVSHLQPASIQFEFQGQIFELKTKNYKTNLPDTTERTQIQLGKYDEKKSRWDVSIRTQGGLPVFNLNQDDFVFLASGKSYEAWGLRKINPVNKSSIGPNYQLTAYPSHPSEKTVEGESGSVPLETLDLVTSDDASLDNASSAEPPAQNMTDLRIDFENPSFGEYVPLEVAIKIRADASIQSAELFLDDTSLKKWESSPFETIWDASDLKNGTHILKVIGKTQSENVSSWISISSGQGSLAVETKDLKIDFEKIGVVLDSSLSLSDGWDGSSKWNWIKKIFQDSRVVSNFGQTEIGLVASGSRNFLQDTCEDSLQLQKITPFRSGEISEALGKIRPSGLFGLKNALTDALQEKPQKILVLTDGIGKCSSGIQAVKDKLKRSQTVVEIVALGPLLDKDKHILEGLGIFEEVADGEALIEKVAASVKPILKLSHHKKVLTSPLTDKDQELRAGTYLLDVPIHPPMDPLEIQIRNQSKTKIKLHREGDKTVATPLTNAPI